VLSLNGSDMVYEKGMWKNDSTIALNKTIAEDMKSLQNENKMLREKNNLLEYKLQLLIDMV
jgi:hypothetical protein